MTKTCESHPDAFQLQSMVDAMPMLVATADRNYIFRSCNQAYAKWYNKTPEQICGQSIEQLAGRAAFSRTQLAADRALSGETFEVEGWIQYDIEGLKKTQRYIQAQYQPVRAADGEVAGFCVVANDLTDVRLSDERFQTMADTAPVLVWITNNDSVSTWFNKGWLEFTGQTLEQQISKGWMSGIHPDDIDALKEIYQKSFAEQKPFDSEYRLKDRNGEYRWIKDRSVPRFLADGGFDGFVGGAMDIHDQKMLTHRIARAQAAVENERENFRSLFKQTPEMVCITSGPEHLFDFVNEAHERVLGFNATGQSVRQAQPESIEVHSILDNVYRTGITAELFEIPVTLSHRLRYFNLTYAARRNEAGEINGVMILGTEITESFLQRDALRESQERYQQVFDWSPLPKWVFDRQTLKFVDVNYAALRHYGFSKDEFLNMTILDIRPPEDAALLREALGTNLPKESNSTTHGFRHIKKDGTLINVEISALDLQLTGRDLRIAAIIDVTERLASDARQNELLESLQSAKEEAERANELKSAFLANMSHEIRTPLGAMLGFADLLRDPGLSRSEHSNYINILTRNGEQLSAIINDILDLSKIEAGHLTLEFTDTSTAEVAADVVSLLSVKAKEKDLVLEYRAEPSTPVSVVSDPLRVRQVLMNLVGNAIKFTQFGSIKIRSYGEANADGQNTLVFEVTDTGIGIPPSQRERIFEMFVQADGTLARRFGGTGLGLALSRQLARGLGGDIAVTKTAEGRGSTFQFVTLDQPERRTEPSSSRLYEPRFEEDQVGQLDGIKVLVVDDSPDNQQMIWHFLNKHGITVDSAEDGYVGYKKALAGDHDLILMDIQMPQMDGYTATQKLREAGFTKPIIALTAHAMSEVRKKCLNIGCTDHLTKPIKVNDLVGTIAKYTRDAAQA